MLHLIWKLLLGILVGLVARLLLPGANRLDLVLRLFCT